MKKWMAYTLVGGVVLGAVLHHTASANAAPNPAAEAQQTAHFLEQSFAATKAKVAGYEINNYSTLSNFGTKTNQGNQASTPISVVELAREASRFTQEFPLQNTKTYKYEAANEVYYEVTGNGPDHTHVTATLSSFHYPNAQPSAANTAVLTVRVDGETTNLTHFESVLKKVEIGVSSLKVLPQISACIEGTTSAKIIGDSANKVVDAAFNVVGAKRVEGLQTKLETSISGYSPEGSTVILTNGHKMNLQVAVHYDSVHKRTNILVGTPIITVTY